MNKTTLIRNATIVNDGEIFTADVFIKDGFIDKIDKSGIEISADIVIDAKGKYLLPGVIDEQVHFREPGLTQKGEIYTEAKAAVAGGVTSFMEMPNTFPAATTIELLEQKYARAKECSFANYSFYMGASNSNLDELLRVNEKEVCGVKIFMGSSTGVMLVDNQKALENIFANVQTLIATHCEDDSIIKANADRLKQKFGEDISLKYHPIIRSAEACYSSSSYAVDLAKKFNTRLHILHISTAKELELFSNDVSLSEKRITSEACIHHLWFCDEDYETKGNYIKWNPAIKTTADRDAIFAALLDGKIDVVATDHAPHTLEEKQQKYFNAASGGPLVQHSLQAMLQFYQQKKISLEKVVEKMCHNPAILFDVDRRGFVKEGFYADLVLVDLNKSYTVSKENILYKCGWSPFEGTTFNSTIEKTFVNGNLVFDNGEFEEEKKGMRLKFLR